MTYTFRCKDCGAVCEKVIPIAQYDEVKDKQKCICGEKMERVIEWEGYAKGSGDGWCGNSSGNAI